jgi:hypothetical protein
LSILENISPEFSRMPSFFGQHEKFPKFPQAAQTFALVWKTLQYYYFFYSLCVNYLLLNVLVILTLESKED